LIEWLETEFIALLKLHRIATLILLYQLLMIVDASQYIQLKIIWFDNIRAMPSKFKQVPIKGVGS
jgi:hypothetical protein